MSPTRGAAATALGCAVAAVAISACGSSGGAASTGTNPPTSTSSSTTAATTTKPAPLALGTAYTAKDGAVTLTVQQVKSVTRPITDAGYGPNQVGGAMVKACVAGGDGRFTWDAWTAADPAGIQFLHFGPTGEDTLPSFPTVTSPPVRVGSCAAGWVFFELSTDATIARVTWTSGTDTATWSAT